MVEMAYRMQRFSVYDVFSLQNTCWPLVQCAQYGTEQVHAKRFTDESDIRRLCLQGEIKRAMNGFDQMHHLGIEIHIDTYLCLLQSCSNLKALSEGRHVHCHLVQNMLIPDATFENHLMEMYVRCERMNEACYMFEAMEHRDIVSWNVIIAGFTLYRNAKGAFHYFLKMLDCLHEPDRVTLLNILKLCSVLQEFADGRLVHIYIIENHNKAVDACIGNGLIDMYVNCLTMEDALAVFCRIPEKDLVSWNMLISGYAKTGFHEEALQMFWELLRNGLRPNRITFLGVLRACAGLICLDTCQRVHEVLRKYGLELTLYIGSALVDVYAKCGRLDLGREVFDKLLERNVVVWTSMIAGYVQHENYDEACDLFLQMEKECVYANDVTLIIVLKACSGASYLQLGKQVHSLICQIGLESDVILQSSLVDMYSKCGSIENAKSVIDVMQLEDNVLWNGMIAGCISYGQYRDAIVLFTEMEQRGIGMNEITFVSVLKACANLNMIEMGKKVHLKVMANGIDDNRVLNNMLVDMYHKCGDIDCAFKLFNFLLDRDVVSCNIIMSGYAILGATEEILELHQRMEKEAVLADGVTFLSLLQACASLGALEIGARLHGCLEGCNYQHAITLCNTLIDMYAKCGNIDRALHIFRNMPERTNVSWNAILNGCAQHGYGKQALELFEQMRLTGVRFDHVTLVAIVSACSHVGLLGLGYHYFELMTRTYSIAPTEEAVASMVDLLGRAGCLKEAEVCMMESGFTTYPVVWKALLGACRIHGNFDLARQAAESVFLLKPDDTASFVVLSNICAEISSS